MAVRDLIVQIKTMVDSTGIKRANTEIEEYKRSIGGADTEMKNLSKTGVSAMGDVEDSIGDVSDTMKEVEDATGDAGAEVEELAKTTETATQEMDASFGRVKDAVLVGAAVMAAAIGAAFTVSIIKASDFETKISEVFTLLPDASSGARDQLIQDAKDLSLIHI